MLPPVPSNFGDLTHVPSNFGDLTTAVPSNFGAVLSNFGAVLSNFGVGINTITLLSTPKITLQQQQHGEAEGNAAAAAGRLLDGFEIPQPFKGRILAKCQDVITITAWMLYAITQSGFTQESGIQKFVSRRLMACEEPPARFMRYAQLTPDEWRALWRASRGDPASRTPELDEIAGAWVEDLGDMFPNGPFGDDDPVALANALRRAADEEEARWAAQHPPEPPVSEEEALARGWAMLIDGKAVNIYWIWQQVCGELRLQLTTATFDTWLGRAKPILYKDGVLTIGVHNGYAKDWLEHRLLDMIKRTLLGVIHQTEIELQFVVWGDEAEWRKAQRANTGVGLI